MTARILLMDAQRASHGLYLASAMIQNEDHVLIERARAWLDERLDQPLDQSWALRDWRRIATPASAP